MSRLHRHEISVTQSHAYTAGDMEKKKINCLANMAKQGRIKREKTMNKNEVFFGCEPELEPEPGKQNCGAWRARGCEHISGWLSLVCVEITGIFILVAVNDYGKELLSKHDWVLKVATQSGLCRYIHTVNKSFLDLNYYKLLQSRPIFLQVRD